jgi:Fe-S cluster assembly scaffold protein SufB
LGRRARGCEAHFRAARYPEQERKFLAGVEAQFDSEAVYSNIKKAVGEQGVIFVGSAEGLKEHPEIFRKWFGKVIQPGIISSAPSTALFLAEVHSFTCPWRKGETSASGLLQD